MNHVHGHQHGHGGEHRSLRLAVPHRRVHRVRRTGRRQFLTELGRSTFAIAVVGGFVAACSDGDESGPDPAEGAPASPSSTATDRTGTSTDTTAETTGGQADTSPPSTGLDGGADLRWAQVDLGFVSAYVLVRGSDAVVVDTGAAGSVDQIGAALSTVNASFDDVRHVVLTHSHGDHVGSLPAVLDLAVSATVYAGAGDIPSIASPVDVVAVGDGDDVLGLAVIDTPGHTPGSISVFDPGIGLLVAGDALNGNDAGNELTGANAQFTADMLAADESVRKLAELDVDAIAMGHGQPVTDGAGRLLTALAAEI